LPVRVQVRRFGPAIPRVFIDLLKSPTGEAACPYCGTMYRFTGERPKGHH
jgi:hypothetical protein